MNNDCIKVLELLADIQFIRQIIEEGLNDKTSEQKAFAEGLIEAIKMWN